ncbi:hypothetical protein TNCT_429451 [Trichonephila clavata]|uniref:Uncharacterized protein n=1 Tax=Trichonephila clavata TaxID=2740835 RepID=A0A8X6J564_TRICU|nr:hypothetical protein TNCT_429451 [Trichonephila clavata]
MCTHVFVSRDSVPQPLQSPYDGPYPIVKRSGKLYKVNIEGKPTSISIDKLKLAFIHNLDNTPLHINKSELETKSSLRQTYSSCRVHFPDYFISSH